MSWPEVFLLLHLPSCWLWPLDFAEKELVLLQVISRANCLLEPAGHLITTLPHKWPGWLAWAEPILTKESPLITIPIPKKKTVIIISCASFTSVSFFCALRLLCCHIFSFFLLKKKIRVLLSFFLFLLSLWYRRRRSPSLGRVNAVCRVAGKRIFFIRENNVKGCTNPRPKTTGGEREWDAEERAEFAEKELSVYFF